MIKKILFNVAFVFLLFYFAPWARCQWIYTSSFQPIKCFCSSGTKIFGGGFNSLIYSDDSGATWIQNFPSLINRFEVYSLACTDSVIYAGTDSGIFRSFDSGLSWTRILLPYSGYVFAVSLFEGYLFAEDSGRIARSSDMGNHWSKSAQIMKPYQSIQSYFVHRSYLYAWGFDTVPFRSNDTGKTWVMLDYGSHVDSVGNDLYALNGGVIISHDNGNTWSVIDSNLPADFISFITSGPYFFGGADGSFGGVFFSQDTAKNWRLIGKMPRVLTLLSIGDYIIAGTNFGVYRASISDFIADKVHLFQASDLKISLLSNPTTSSADFQFSALQEPAVFELFDALGRSLLRRELPAGQASLHVDMQAFPAGIYFARLGAESVKVIKIYGT